MQSFYHLNQLLIDLGHHLKVLLGHLIFDLSDKLSLHQLSVNDGVIEELVAQQAFIKLLMGLDAPS